MAASLFAAFEQFDKDGSGYLTADEVIGVLTRQSGGKQLTLEDAQQCIAHFDVDGDGKMSYAEFCTAMGKLAAGAAPAQRRARFGADELGQTNNFTVGPNFIYAMTKGRDGLRDSKKGWFNGIEGKWGKSSIKGLAAVGFPKLGRYLQALYERIEEVNGENWAIKKVVTHDERVALFSAIAQAYTREGCDEDDDKAKSLYRELNLALRHDDPSLDVWSYYIALLYWGALGDQPLSGCTCAPSSMLPSATQTVYRGLSMPADMGARYREGEHFFWSTFVSTSKDRALSEAFAAHSATDEHASFLFVIELPPCDTAINSVTKFWAYELEAVTVFPGEKEVLLPPYTQFEVTEAPRQGRRCTEVALRAVAQPLSGVFEHITVWIDPSGFEAVSNFELAKHAFLSGMPNFRLLETASSYEEENPPFPHPGLHIHDGLTALGLFTGVKAALQWIGEQVQANKNCTPLLKLVASGGISEDFFHSFHKAYGSCPHEAMIFCGDEAKWHEVWRDSPRVRVTSDPAVVREYLTHTRYTTTFKRATQLHEMRQLAGDAWEGGKPGYLAEKARVWYPWKRIDGGVVYGGIEDSVKTYHCSYLDVNSTTYGWKSGNWETGTGTLPNVTMAPFESWT